MDPTLIPLLQRGCNICFIKIKEGAELDLPHLLTEFKEFAYHFATTQPSEKICIVGEGPLAGLIALSSYVEQAGIYHSGVFVSPITDLEEYLAKCSEEDSLGFGDLTNLDQYKAMIGQSPYQMQDLKFLKNALFISSDHSLGFHSLKLYAKSKHLTQKLSNNYWVKTEGDVLEDRALWTSYLCGNLFLGQYIKQVQQRASKRSIIKVIDVENSEKV